METLFIAGCYGEIGLSLVECLKSKYHIIGCDIVEKDIKGIVYYKCDASNYDQLDLIFNTHDIDTVINLAGIQEKPNIPSLEDYYKMVDCYLNSTFIILTLMKKHGIKKMILASTNHVTDYYEKDGYSTLNREINTNDYPISTGVYGSIKLAAENICRNFYINYGIKSVIFRIGTYRKNYNDVSFSDRWYRTRITKEDLLKYFEKAIENNNGLRVCYLVSNNKDKPWDTTDLLYFNN